MSSPAQWWVTVFNTSPSDSLTERARAPGESSLTRVYTQAATSEEARNRARQVRSQLMHQKEGLFAILALVAVASLITGVCLASGIRSVLAPEGMALRGLLP